ncbi:hypothetical protein VSDG_03609 [Cytospora chrysosperma]|uniref:GTP cyclohydrolase 1 n=1 Tax=Cytospora chrysosperma TaxID=252740 RepID=A0A423WA77_CYTCH|nr:hypothetical protein VSDG_03609 [Valsa sordida]
MEAPSSSSSASSVDGHKGHKRKSDDERSPVSKKSRHGKTNGAATDVAAEERLESLGHPPQDLQDVPHPKEKSKNTETPDELKDGAATLVTPSPETVADLDGLRKPGRGTRERLEETTEQANERLAKMCAAVKVLLECVGEDVSREGLLATPQRYANAMLSFTKGYQENVHDIVNGAIFDEGHNEMVTVKNIEIFSMCEHHLVPFIGKMHIGYIPNQSVIGISKLPRIAEMFARRLQIQERLTRDVANTIMEVLAPRGVAVVMESSHLCMVMRGVEKTSTTTITSCVLGCFERKKTRNEFLSLIGVNRT